LADAGLDDPVLHEAIDGVVGEGLSDVMLYGASVKRVAKPIEGGVLFASAGTPVADAAEVMAHPRWETVIHGFQEAGALLLVHLPADTPGADALLEQAAGVVVVADNASDVIAVGGTVSERVLAVIGPEAPGASEVADETPDVVDPEVVEPDVVADVDDEKEAEFDPTTEADEPADGGLFSMDELPESTGNAADEIAESTKFGFEGMAGEQYDTPEGEPAPEPVVTEPLELDEPVVEALEAEAPVVEQEADPAGASAVEGVTRSAVEMDKDAVAEAAESAHLDMDGFETGAGFDLEDASDDDGADLMLGDEAGFGGESEEELEEELQPAEEFGFGDGGLEVEASPFAEAEVAEVPGVPEAPEDFDAPAIGGGAGDDTFGDGEAGSLAVAPPGVGSVDKGSIAVDAAAEAMGLGTGPSEEESVPEISLELEDGGLAKMSVLEELERRRQRGARIRQFVVGGVTALIVGGGGVGSAYFGLVNIPGITPPDRVRSAVPAPIELPGPTPVTPVITHVLTVDAWRTLETALSTIEALRDRLPDVLFFVTLIEVDGGDQYALLAGPAFSAVEADAIKGPLTAVLDRLDPATWIVHEAQYSFFFGEYSDAADAAGRVQSLTVLSIPAHTLQVEYPDGTTGLRVYGGAFVDEFQAAAMGRLLRANDLSDVRLTQRRGRLPE